MAYVVKRLLWMLPTILGITLITFLLMELAPGDRASLELEQGQAVKQRARALQQLRMHYGLVDETGAPRPVLVRYVEWLGRAVRLDLAGPNDDPQQFRGRILAALPVTLLLNALAAMLAFAVAVPLGAWLGMRAGSATDRGVSAVLLSLYGFPEFLVATLLVLVFGGGLFAQLLPVVGLRSEGAGEWPAARQVTDMAAHLVLPVLTLAFVPCAVVARFLRESVARAAASEFVLALRGWGLPEPLIRARALRNGLSPLVTLLGTMPPMLISGSVVVESAFTLPGMGSLTYRAVGDHDLAMVMALTLLVAATTLLGLLLSDVLQRVVDPRVQLR